MQPKGPKKSFGTQKTDRSDYGDSKPRSFNKPTHGKPDWVRDGDRPQGGFKPRDNGGGGYSDRPKRDFTPRDGGNRSFGDRPQGGYSDRPQRDFTPRDGGNRSFGDRPQGGYSDRPKRDFTPRDGGNRSFGDRPQGGYSDRPQRDFKPRDNNGGSYGDRPQGGFKPRDNNGGGYGDRPQGGFKPRDNSGGGYGDRPQGGFKPRDNNDFSERPVKEFVILTPEEKAEAAELAQRKAQAAKNFREIQRERTGVRELGQEVDDILSDNLRPRKNRAQDQEQEFDRPTLTRGKARDTKTEIKDIRLNRFVAQSGVCSRRDADALISQGLVSVNGEVVTEMGAKVNPVTAVIEYGGKKLSGEKKVYIVMNKPKGYIASVEDPHNERTVIDLLRDKVPQRVYPVGRLDKNTTGVLLLTNDGELTRELTHPSFEHKKIYHVFLDKPCTVQHLEDLSTGIILEDGEVHADEVSFVDGNRKEVGVEMHSGRNRIVRRMFEHLGYEVTKLDRVYFAGFTKSGLRRGYWRVLTPKEVSSLLNKKFQ